VPEITSDILVKAMEKRANGLGWLTIARRLKVSMYTLRTYLDPAYVANKRNKKRLLEKNRRDREYEPYAPPPPPLIEKDPLLDRLKAGLGHQYQD
jgi:hypothetical protein